MRRSNGEATLPSGNPSTHPSRTSLRSPKPARSAMDLLKMLAMPNLMLAHGANLELFHPAATQSRWPRNCHQAFSSATISQSQDVSPNPPHQLQLTGDPKVQSTQSRTKVNADHATPLDQLLSLRLPSSSMVMTFPTSLSSKLFPAVRATETKDATVVTNHMSSNIFPRTTKLHTLNTHTSLVMVSLQLATPLWKLMA